MLYAFFCYDRPGSAELRQQTRPRHVAYIDGIADRLFLAGPLLADDGSTPLGSLLIVECADRSAAEAFAAGDPYALAGLFERVEIRAFKKTRPG